MYAQRPTSPPHSIPSRSRGTRRAPVRDVLVLPLEVALKGQEFAQVWDATARGTHSRQGGVVQLTSLRQRQATLEKPQCPTQGLIVVAQLGDLSVAIAEQIFLWMEGQRHPKH